MALRPISIGDYAKVATPDSLGKPPKLEWLAIKDLVVDPDYQREIARPPDRADTRSWTDSTGPRQR
jgi:hypothetical protein